MFEAFCQALALLFRPDVLGLAALGTLIGLVFGVLPGLGGIIAVAVLLPFTYGMEPTTAMLFLCAVMGAVPFGGSVSAILINTPGTAQNICTTFDGFPMARRGEASRALGISATASGLGALFGLVVLVMLIPVVRQVVLLIGPPEIFMLILMGMVTIALAARGNLVKGLCAGGLGMLISFIGFSPVFGVLRFNFGSEYLWDGVQLIPVVIGLFGITELINYAVRGGTIAAERAAAGGSMVEGVKDVFRHKLCFLRSSAIGTIVGIIPGIGGTVATFLSYVIAMQTSKHPETYGKGNPEGVVAAESANNAKDGGSVLPTVGFGVPGSAEMVVLLGAFMLHGIFPGPTMIKEHLDIVFAIIVGFLISNILASTLGLLAANSLAGLTRINTSYIAFGVAVLCFVGAFTMRENIWDVVMALLLGFFGYGMVRLGFPTVNFTTGYILGILAELYFSQSLMISYGSYAIFFTRPISLTFFVLTLFILVYSFRRGRGSEKG